MLKVKTVHYSLCVRWPGLQVQWRIPPRDRGCLGKYCCGLSFAVAMELTFLACWWKVNHCIEMEQTLNIHNAYDLLLFLCRRFITGFGVQSELDVWRKIMFFVRKFQRTLFGWDSLFKIPRISWQPLKLFSSETRLIFFISKRNLSFGLSTVKWLSFMLMRS